MLSVLNRYINDNFGSKRGFYFSAKYRAITMIGGYAELRIINWSEVKRLIFICSGNICRSPLAEYVAKSEQVDSESFGLHCRGGDKADPRAIKFGMQQRLDLSKHVTRNIRDYTYVRGDLLIGMEPAHVNELKTIVDGQAPITSAALFLDAPNVYLHDPFGAGEGYFNKCEMLVTKAAKVISGYAKPGY